MLPLGDNQFSTSNCYGIVCRRRVCEAYGDAHLGERGVGGSARPGDSQPDHLQGHRPTGTNEGWLTCIPSLMKVCGDILLTSTTTSRLRYIMV